MSNKINIKYMYSYLANKYLNQNIIYHHDGISIYCILLLNLDAEYDTQGMFLCISIEHENSPEITTKPFLERSNVSLSQINHYSNNNSIYLYSAISPELKFCSEALVTTLA